MGVAGVGEFLAMKYLYIGIIYVCLLLSCLAPILSYLLRRNTSKKYSKQESLTCEQKRFLENVNLRVALPIILTVNIWFLIMFILLFLSEPDLLSKHKTLTVLTFLPLFANSFTTTLSISGKIDKNSDIVLKWCILVATLALVIVDIIVFSEAFYTFLKMFKEGGFFFFLSIALFGIYFWRFYIMYDRIKEHNYALAMTPLWVCFFFILYFLSILSYSRFVYNYIPVEKGGGDYSYSTKVILHFEQKHKVYIPDDLLRSKGSNCSKDVKILHESDKALLVAEARDDIDWHDLRLDVRPTIHDIKRDSILSIQYLRKE